MFIMKIQIKQREHLKNLKMDQLKKFLLRMDRLKKDHLRMGLPKKALLPKNHRRKKVTTAKPKLNTRTTKSICQ